MVTVSETVVRYAARGAKKVQRADRQVRDSINETAKTARKESGTIRQWMQQHKTALTAIAAATTGLMAGIISKSPTIQAELASVRIAFSLLAMEIGQSLQPAFRTIGDLALDVADWFGNLPQPVKDFTAAMIALTPVAIAAAAAIALSGTAIGATIVSIAAAAAPILVLVGVVALLYTAWKNNWLGIRDITMGILNWLKVQFQKRPKVMLAAWQAFLALLRGDWATVWRKIKTIIATLWPTIIAAVIKHGRRLVAKIQAKANDIKQRFLDLVAAAKRWGRDLMRQFAEGIISRARAVRRRVESIMDDVRDAMSFDQSANDRMARRWGQDMVRHFARGMESQRSQLQRALPQQQPAAFGATAAPAGGGGTTVNVTFEAGAIQTRRSAPTSRQGTRELADEVGDEFARRFNLR